MSVTFSNKYVIISVITLVWFEITKIMLQFALHFLCVRSVATIS